MDITGTCSRNSLCTAINCVDNSIPSITLSTEVVFSPCSYPISVHHFIARTVQGSDTFVIMDEISTRNQTIKLQSLYTGTINVVSSKKNTGVTYGVSLLLLTTIIIISISCHNSYESPLLLLLFLMEC